MDEIEHEDRAWLADRRDFVAERRDVLADRRDSTADERERTADERDRLADLRDAPEAGDPTKVQAHGSSPALGDEARGHRELRGAEREAASVTRAAAEERRLASTPTTGLASAFAEIARYFLEAEDFQAVLERVVDTAVSVVSGCSMASVSVRDRRGQYATPATTHDAAVAADLAQYGAGEGPCLDAMDEPFVHAPSLPDERWPTLGDRPRELGMHAVLSYRLDGSGPSDQYRGGSLNGYAVSADAFDDEAVEVGLILAAHASVAMRVVSEVEAARTLSSHLEIALASRDVIGQAKGILMERLRLTPEDAFDLLRRSSQSLNVKLREIAEHVAETGELAD